MDRNQLREIVLHELGEIAPEADPATVAGDELIQEVLDIDSFDFLTFVQRLHDRTGVDIPEVDYPRVATLDGLVDYLASRAGTNAPTGAAAEGGTSIGR